MCFSPALTSSFEQQDEGEKRRNSSRVFWPGWPPGGSSRTQAHKSSATQTRELLGLTWRLAEQTGLRSLPRLNSISLAGVLWRRVSPKYMIFHLKMGLWTCLYYTPTPVFHSFLPVSLPKYLLSVLVRSRGGCLKSDSFLSTFPRVHLCNGSRGTRITFPTRKDLKSGFSLRSFINLQHGRNVPDFQDVSADCGWCRQVEAQSGGGANSWQEVWRRKEWTPHCCLNQHSSVSVLIL